MCKTKRRAFTYFELVTVMALFGIMAAIGTIYWPSRGHTAILGARALQTFLEKAKKRALLDDRPIKIILDASQRKINLYYVSNCSDVVVPANLIPQIRLELNENLIIDEAVGSLGCYTEEGFPNTAFNIKVKEIVSLVEKQLRVAAGGGSRIITL